MLRLNADKSKSYFYRFVYGHIPAVICFCITFHTPNLLTVC